MDKLEKIGKRLTLRYILIHGLYWALYATCWGFLAVTLAFAGLNNTQSGMVICLGLLGSAVAQPVLSSIVDQYPRITSRGVALGLMLSTAACGVLLWLFQGARTAFAVLYVLLGISVITISPFLNSMCMELVRRGISINFGLSRGIGSLTYAATALVLGGVIERFTPAVTLILTTVLALSVAAAIAWFRPGDVGLPPEPVRAERPQPLPIAAFLRHVPGFLTIMIGGALLMGAHCFLNSYMNLVVERVGGAESSMGITLGLSAAAEMPAMLLFMYLRKRGVSSKIIFRFCSFFFILKPLAAYFVTSVGAVYVGQMLQFFSTGLYLPLVPYFVTDVVDDANQVKGQALMSTAGTGISWAWRAASSLLPAPPPWVPSASSWAPAGCTAKRPDRRPLPAGRTVRPDSRPSVFVYIKLHAHDSAP